MTTHLYTHDIFADHITPAGHPERPDRIRAVKEALSGDEFNALIRFETKMVDESRLTYAHPEAYLENIRKSVPDEGQTRLDPDTVLSPKSWECVCHAVGGGLMAVDAVISGDADNAFLAARAAFR